MRKLMMCSIVAVDVDLRAAQTHPISDPVAGCQSMVPKSGHRFSERSCSIKRFAKREESMRRFGAFLLLAALATPAAAEFPDKPIRLIVPQAPGSATDTVARILGAEPGKEVGQLIVVDNTPASALTI